MSRVTRIAEKKNIEIENDDSKANWHKRRFRILLSNS